MPSAPDDSADADDRIDTTDVPSNDNDPPAAPLISDAPVVIDTDPPTV